MKRFFAAAALALAMVLPLFSQEEKRATQPVWDHGDNISSITYQNVRIFKIYDQKDSYVVLYEKQGIDIGTAVLPKKWFKNENGARKLNFRTAPKGLAPYMTVIKQNGEFLKVWVTAPTNRYNSLWAIAPSGMQIEGTDAETLTLDY
ncbi:hypothetical protein [Treponema sp.]|uniref:hypothetical protein n=1 Tax=Treponema sp. TaxID=166 RepID=UPI003F07B930